MIQDIDSVVEQFLLWLQRRASRVDKVCLNGDFSWSDLLISETLRE